MPLAPGHRVLTPLEGERVRLRAHRDDDADAAFAVLSDPRVMRYWSRPAMAHPDEARKQIENIREHVAAGTLLQWAIARRDDDNVIGHVSLFALYPAHQRAELGYALAAAHWGQGFAREALTLALDHAFATLGLGRIEADVDPRNEASIKLVEHLGFRHEGTLRRRWFVANEYQDSALYGLLAEDWRRPSRRDDDAAP
jgi:RimJ/RimL family protein N-acetyltransferase